MTLDKATLQSVIDYCNEKWLEARDQVAVIPVQDIDIQPGRKMAYNDVLQHARQLLDATPAAE
jgi:hypothetical protein